MASLLEIGSRGVKHRSRDTREKTIVLICMAEDGSNSEKQSGSRYIWESSLGCPAYLEVEIEYVYKGEIYVREREREN